MNNSGFYETHDYAEMALGDNIFYYGYEVTRPFEHQTIDEYKLRGGQWCFEAVINNIKLVIPFEELNERDMLNVKACLWEGVSKIFNQYALVVNNT